MTESAAPETDAQKKARADALRKAYGLATTEVRENHRDEFEQAYVKHAAALGVQYTPPPSKAEKARQALAELLAANPEIRAELVDEVKKGLEGEPVPAGTPVVEMPAATR